MEPNAPNTPEWVNDAVFYQIFPDRFARSGRLSQPANLLPWEAPPHAEKYHGGDLLGIVERHDYLQDLGINALYLNPIFQSACNHRYHTHDYYQVDPLLGGNAALRELVTACHERGMRVVLDGVFNHASRGFFQFNDILENGPHSPWIDWFLVEDWPLAPYDGGRPANYVSWVGNRALPKWNTENPQVREYLWDVAEFWIREFDIDGWRLDVPAEIQTAGFWETFRRRIRAIKPDAYSVGEIWDIAPAWLAGDRFDANMNYPFTAAVTAFVGGERISPRLVKGRSYNPFPGIDAAGLTDRLAALLDAYHWETTLVMLNSLDSHDTPRLLSVVRGDRASLRLATLFQMSYPGAPCVYYGDEIALRGTDRPDEPHDDKDARWPFPWNEPESWDRDMLADFKALIRLRRDRPLLRRGRFTTLWAEGADFAFARHDETGAMVVALNVSDEPAALEIPAGDLLAEGTRLRACFGPAGAATVRGGRISLTLPPRSGVILEQD